MDLIRVGFGMIVIHFIFIRLLTKVVEVLIEQIVILIPLFLDLVFPLRRIGSHRENFKKRPPKQRSRAHTRRIDLSTLVEIVQISSYLLQIIDFFIQRLFNFLF